MAAMAIEDYFTFKYDTDAGTALLHAIPRKFDMTRLHVERQAGFLTLSIPVATEMRAAITAYAAENLREGSDHHRHLRLFCDALGDTLIMETARRERQRQESETPVSSVPEEALAAEAEKTRRDAMRDDILREIFTGGPRKKINIWGNVVVEEPPGQPVVPDTHIAEQQREENLRKMGAAYKFKTSWSGLLLLDDNEADELLTGGQPQTHNEDMKREGACLLLQQRIEGGWGPGPVAPRPKAFNIFAPEVTKKAVDQWNQERTETHLGHGIQGTVVGTVWGFAKARNEAAERSRQIRVHSFSSVEQDDLRRRRLNGKTGK